MTDTDGLHTTTYGDSGSLVVFCHGLFGQGRNWTQIAKALAADHRVLLVDMPDHGRSAWTEQFDYVGAADRVAGLLSADEPVALVGHSMGGKIAMLVALRHPELVERLAVVDVSPVSYRQTDEFRGYIDAMQAIDLSALQRRGDADEQLREAVPDDGIRSFLLQNLRRDGDGWRWAMNLPVLGRDLDRIGAWPAEELKAYEPYDGPVLWLAGELSNYVTDEYAPAMKEWFPRYRKVTIKGAGHWVHSEKPETFLAALRQFLGD